METVVVIPRNRFVTIITTYAVLGTLKKNEAGYIRGVTDHLNKDMMEILINSVAYTGVKTIQNTSGAFCVTTVKVC